MSDVNFLTPSQNFDYRDYYYNPQGQTVYFPNASPPIDPPPTPDVNVDFSNIVRDKYDPEDSPYFLPSQQDVDRLVTRLQEMRSRIGSHSNVEFFHGGGSRRGRMDLGMWSAPPWPSSNWVIWLVIGVAMLAYFRMHK
jgi:hypothetical protein